MKYIMFEVPLGPMWRKIPIIFPDNLVHADVADAMRRAGGELRKAKVVSAGFVNLCEVECHGGSETLKCSSKPGDSDVIAMYDYLHGL